MSSTKIAEQKVILLGDYGVGKSSLFRRFAFDTFVETNDRKSTIGLDFYDRVITLGDSTNIKIQLWDTCGLERVASLTSSYYKWSEGVILVFSLEDLDTFHSLAQHLLEVVSHAQSAKIFLCANKVDLVDEERIAQVQSDVQIFCDESGDCIKDVYYTSCKTNEGIEEMFCSIANHLATTNLSRLHLNHLNDELASFRLTQETPEEQTGSCCF